VSAQILVPQLGESIVEARVARWLKQPGDAVSAGEAVVELETEKIDLEVGAEQAGVLVEIKRQEGEDVKVGELLGVVGPGESVRPAATPPRPAPSKTPGEAGRPAPGPARAPAAADTPAPPVPSTPTRAGESQADRATPTARKIAEQHAIDLTRIAGTGEGGRVTKRDVESVITPSTAPAGGAAPSGAAGQSATPLRADSAARAAEAVPPAAPAHLSTVPSPEARVPTVPSPSAERIDERVRMSKRRLTIARNLVEAQQTAAMLTTFNEVDMGAIMTLRERRKEAFKQRHGVTLGIASFFVKASIAALEAFPRLNAEIQGDEMVLKRYYDIGMAVGAPQGLVVPVIRNAERMTFAQIEQAIRDLARRANEGTLTFDDLRGGTFTITNGGVFGSLLSTPILNPPQVGILGLHKIEERPVVIGGQIVVRPMMYTALTYDHRIVDGLEAVQFLVRVKELIEDPGNLLLES
jgi:2-oxoglutarate dehydrogenase E2 component (dihydrolipoamide succinyltransferase)